MMVKHNVPVEAYSFAASSTEEDDDHSTDK